MTTTSSSSTIVLDMHILLNTESSPWFGKEGSPTSGSADLS
ncbi:hypothetical protein [Pseudonocardia oceani]|nr:hypothetical protein [Pseudonocardia oceani]